jgi:hypothetical protein
LLWFVLALGEKSCAHSAARPEGNKKRAGRLGPTRFL